MTARFIAGHALPCSHARSVYDQPLHMRRLPGHFAALGAYPHLTYDGAYQNL
jgi:hypothetical protein